MALGLQTQCTTPAETRRGGGGNTQRLVTLVLPKSFNEAEFERIKPNLRVRVVSLDMDVRWFKTICHVEEKSVTTFA
jgi:hypothetical protein